MNVVYILKAAINAEIVVRSRQVLIKVIIKIFNVLNCRVYVLKSVINIDKTFFYQER